MTSELRMLSSYLFANNVQNFDVSRFENITTAIGVTYENLRVLLQWPIHQLSVLFIQGFDRLFAAARQLDA